MAGEHGYTRALLNKACPGVPAEVLNPASSWPSQDGYMARYRQLAHRFVDNFKKFESQTAKEVCDAGPKV